MNDMNLTVHFPIRLPAWLADEVLRVAKDEARRAGERPNMSATARKAIVAYIEARKEVQCDDHENEG